MSMQPTIIASTINDTGHDGDDDDEADHNQYLRLDSSAGTVRETAGCLTVDGIHYEYDDSLNNVQGS